MMMMKKKVSYTMKQKEQSMVEYQIKKENFF